MPNTPRRRSSRGATLAAAALAALTFHTAPAITAGADLDAGHARAAVHRVTIENMAFTPASITVRAGDTVVWTNKDVVDHTATAANKAFDVTIAAGKSGQAIVKTSGSLAYSCRFHPNMKGRVVVK